MICRKKCDEKTVLKEISLVDKDGEIIKWSLCEKCYNLWANEEYRKLARKMR